MNDSTSRFDPIAAPQSDEALLQDALAFIGDLDLGEANSNDGILFSLLQECSDDISDSGSPEPQNVLSSSNQDLTQRLPDDNVTLQSSVIYTPSVPVVAPSTPSPPTLAWPAATMAPTKKPRTKRRDELVHLRSLVGHLENQLLELKQSVNDRQSAKGGGDKTNKSAASNLVLSAWENVAARQQEHRQRAERENLRLKRVLEDQIKVGRSLENLLLRKRPKLESISPSTVEVKDSQPSPPCAWNEELVFDDLVGCIDVEYRKTAESMAKVAHECPSVNHHDVAIIQDDFAGMVLQSCECRVFPFKYAIVTEELWDVYPEIPGDKVQDLHCVERSETLIKIRFKVGAFVGPVHGEIDAYFASLRFVEAGRTVFVSSAVFTPVKLGGTDMTGISMHHTSWTILEPVATTPTRTATKLTTRALAIPQVCQPVDDQKRKIGAFTNFLLSAMSVELESSHQMLENRLFSRTASQP